MNRLVRASSFVAATALPILSVVGCASESDESASLIDDLAQRARAAGFEEQAAILETGMVSEDDVLDATVAARQCVEDLGLEVTPIVRNFRGDLSYSFDTTGASDVDEALAAADECQDHYQSLVAQAYSRLNPDRGDPGVDQVSRCVVERGGDFESDVATFEALLEATQLAADDSDLVICFREFVATSSVVVE